MEEAITTFHKQFNYNPEIRNASYLDPNGYKHYVFAGMGGSHLAAGILKQRTPGLELYVHRDYDLPPYEHSFFKKSLLIASSYSGNTEEVVSFVLAGIEKGYDVAVITTGGRLLEIAEAHNLAHIVLPNDGIQPRSALGYSTLALAALMQQKQSIAELHALATTLHPMALQHEGMSLATSVGSKIPIIYSSTKNLAIAYNWKIKCNETAKTPAFYNLLPELNHNEMQGFDISSNTFHFIMLRDGTDHPRVQKRMTILADQLEARGHEVTTLFLEGDTVFHTIFTSLLIADWMTLTLAETYDREPEAVPMIEDFKEKLAKPYEDPFTDSAPWA